MAQITYLNECNFDFGAISLIPKSLKSLGINSPMIITDKGLKNSGVLDKILAAMGNNPVAIYDETQTNPIEAQVLEALEVYRNNNADGIIALGGGSPMDLSKAVALMATHEGPLARFGISQRGSKHIGKIAPVLAITTTSGTGSEVSVGAVIVLENGFKETMISPNLIPPIAICDPELTIGLPPILTAATGMDAVTHCIEAILANAINPPADAIGLDGIEKAIGKGYLKRAVKDGTDKEARYNMMMASTEGALAFVKGLGAVHGLAHGAGRLKTISLHHGTLNALFLPHVLALIEERKDEIIGDKLFRIKRAMGLDADANLTNFILELNKELGLPSNIAQLGLSEDHRADIVKNAMLDLCHLTNCLKFSEEDYINIYNAALGK